MSGNTQIDASFISAFNYSACAKIYQVISAIFAIFFRYVILLCKLYYVNLETATEKTQIGQSVFPFFFKLILVIFSVLFNFFCRLPLDYNLYSSCYVLRFRTLQPVNTPDTPPPTKQAKTTNPLQKGSIPL